MKERKQEYIDYVKGIYPEMVEDWWAEYGELHFYKNEYHALHGEVYACIKENGKFKILIDF